MAPSTDHLLYYIYGKGSAVTLLLILVNATLISAIMLLACTFCMKSRQVDFLKNKSRTKRPNSELKKVIALHEIETRETNGIQNGVIATGTEVNSKENNKTASLKPGGIRGSVMSESGNTSADLSHRVLPPPPKDLQAPPPAEALDDPLYDSVKEIRAAPSNNHDVTIAPGPSSLERKNPLYVSADEMPDPSYQAAIFEYPSAEANKKDKDNKTQVVDESLYAVIRKQPSVKTPPPPNPEPSASHKVIIMEEIKIDNQTVSFINKEKTPRSQSPSEKLDSMLNKCKKRGLVSAPPPKGDKTVNITQNAPPLVPAKRFDIEREFEQYTIEEETEIDKEPPSTT